MNSGDTGYAITFPQQAHWGFWGTIIWGALILVVFVVLQAVTTVVAVALGRAGLSESEIQQLIVSAAKNGNILSLVIIISSAVCFGLLVAVIKIKKDSALREYLAVRPVSLKTMLTWVGLLMGFLILSDLITTILGRPIVPDFMSAAYPTADPVLAFWFALIVVAPLFEETFFRGFLFRGLESSFAGPIGTVVVTAGLWTAIHIQYGVYELATIFCLGLLLGTARALTGSLLVPLGLHMITNLAATIEAAVQA